MKILIANEDLQARVAELAAQINSDYAGKCPVLICVLKGAIFFMADLARGLDFDLEMEFMAVSSYGRRPTAREWCGSSRISTLTSRGATC